MTDKLEHPVSIEARLEAIEERNRRVELDKGWETSWTRRLGVAGMTYVFTALVFRSLGAGDPFRSAVIPTTGYLLSTLSLPILRKWWMRAR